MKTLFALLISAWVLIACNKQTYSLADESQSFNQEVKYNSKVDMVLMVDDSSSMSTYQNKLADQMPAMVDSLNRKGLDYRIVVVTSNMQSGGSGGKFVGNPKILSKNTSNLSGLLVSRIKQGNFGSDSERGLESIQKALTMETGFLREDAILAVVALSNEDDHSPGSAIDYKNFFDTLKPHQQGWNGHVQGWVVNFIGLLDLNSPCSTSLDGQVKEPGLEWMALADASGGSKSSICEQTMVQTVANIEKRILEAATDFLLEKKPKIETLVVKVNDAKIESSTTNGWEYIPSKNAIRFHGTAIPGPSAQISVDFTPAEAN
ncbi:MAG: hypothetical protein ACAH59_00365 [Pseudobdellovibrionaceae bacterium]